MLNGDGKYEGSTVKKEIILFGMKNEILSINWDYQDEQELVHMIQFVHNTAYKELLSRSLTSMCDWSSRVRTLFITHRLDLISHVVLLSKNEVNQLNGGGYKTRKEIFDTFKVYKIDIPNWMPGYYYERANYKFTE